VAEDQLAILRRHRLAPSGISHPLLVDRNAFAEPTGHSVFSLFERHDMTKLVPQNAFPVRRSLALTGRAIGGDHTPKANAQEPRAARQTERADRKVSLLG